MQWRPELSVEQVGSPQRIAPYSVAASADVLSGDTTLSTGRIILLHNPRGDIAWEGDYRCVVYVRAEVDLDMVSDPLLSEVGWSWLTDSLQQRDAEHIQPAGTVTVSYSRSFGAIANTEDSAVIELRASWTPQLDQGRSFTPHLEAFQDLLFAIGGLPPLPSGVFYFQRAGRRT